MEDVVDDIELRRFIFLTHSCRNPWLANCIRSAKIRLTGIELQGPGKDSHNEILSHLSKSTSLVRLSAELGSYKWDTWPALYKFTTGSFHHLRDLSITLCMLEGNEPDWYLPAETLLRFYELPYLEAFSVRAPIERFKTKVQPRPAHSNLRKLRFEKYRTSGVGVLEYILSLSPNLESLELEIPNGATKRDRMTTSSTPELDHSMGEPLDLSFYVDLITPLAARLRNLKLTLHRDFVLSPLGNTSDTGPGINLSSFTNISSLTLSPELIFGTIDIAAQCSWAKQIWTVLPPRLKSLRMDFHAQGIFWTVQDVLRAQRSRELTSTMEQTIDRYGMDFLLGLVHQDRDRTAPPMAITLHEKPEIMKEELLAFERIHWAVAQWNVPVQLNDAVRMAGANLNIRLRVPERLNHPDFKVLVPWDWEVMPRIFEGDEEESFYYE
ncbi:hypothetical protein F5Y00DRAFT_244124 [Daldinia vernicosa]|uniref:uncharacterized protein n=1 Tax=Daldinia vernicosa TaxID=114800 RepID=UPI002008D207|nr:uncharacterized protein F5Y00DRAFT_244124 [Daldinia vernicosa]KAI0846456.1 hypothetical protein F5Y00DRAFT_244124 [Daldinia vernicosa]